MPPYKPVKSKAQSRKLFQLAKEGKISEDDARGKTRAAKGKRLPERVKRRSR
jgi:hypothetical protein